MAKRRKGEPKWTDFKSKLKAMGADQLLVLIRDVVEASPEVRLAFASRLGLLTEAMRETYRDRIDDEFVGTAGGGDWNFSRCLSAVTAYQRAAGDPAGTLDLLLRTLEQGASVADMAHYEAFHDDLSEVIERAIHHCEAHPELAIAECKRINKIVEALEDFGYGTGDHIMELGALVSGEDDDG